MPERESHSGRTLDQVQDYSVIECEQCGFRHLSPIPSQEQLNEFYQKLYYDSHKSDYIKQDLEDLEYLEIHFQDRLDAFSSLTSGRKLLDIGCGAGLFMKYASDRGWESVGLEPSETAYEQAKDLGLRVFNSDFQAFCKDNDETYDVVHLKNVLEHVPDPAHLLQKCHALLAEKGVLYVEVPNDYNFFQRFGASLLKQHKSWLAIPDHINYFTFSSLRRLLQRRDFGPRKRSTTFPIYALLFLGLNFVKNKQSGKKAHRIRMKYDLHLKRLHLNFLRRATYRAMSFFSLGRTIIYYSIKQ